MKLFIPCREELNLGLPMGSKFLLYLSLFIFSWMYAQEASGRQFRRTGIHNGNLVRTVYGNWGVVGQPGNKGPRGAWLHDNNGYIGDVSPMVGAEITTLDTAGNPVKFHSVVISPANRPTSTGFEESPGGKSWSFEPRAGYFNENQESVAMSTDKTTWPPFWPDKQKDGDDPGWRGSWNGYFGKDLQNIQQESFFVMDDNNDEEFNYPQYNKWNVAFKPDSTNPARNGLGLEVKVRGMQWQQFLAQDVLFWLYEVTNTSTVDYTNVVFGMLVGTYVGVTGSDDRPQEYDDDWSFFDVENDITYTGDYGNNVDRNPRWVGDVGMVGYAFLESPGNPYDGIDNDGDFNLISSASAPLFDVTSFDSILIQPGHEVVLIDEQYNRKKYTIPNRDSVIVKTRGATIVIYPGKTYLMEGNIVYDLKGRELSNENAFDGIDNDLDGLVDENYFLHYNQRRIEPDGTVLFDTINPRAYIDYITGYGILNTLIDERRDDGIDNDGDWNAEYDDLGADGIAETGDNGELDGKPTLGEPNFDRTDVDESDQIGLTSFNYFSPANLYPAKEDEELWDQLKPGYFDVPSSISNGQPIAGEDGDFIYGAGYFPLRAGQTERFSVALVYGNDLKDLVNNKKTVQDIYNSDYRFPPPPKKPTMTAVPGDGKVTLYWDRVAEESLDPVTKVKDFQGYKIYRATDPNFNDVRNITDANGLIQGYSTLTQFDKKDGISGYFYPSPNLFQDTKGYTYYLGSETGLVHSFVDENVQNGRTYYYALVAYDHGDQAKDIFPSENSKFISALPTGEIITDQNTAIITPTAKSAGFTLNDTIPLNHTGPGTGSLAINIMDEKSLTGHQYQIKFFDTATDGIDNDQDWNLLTDDLGTDGVAGTNDPDGTESNGKPDYGEPNFDWFDDEEYMPVTTMYSVKNLDPLTESFTPNDTFRVQLSKKNIIPSSVKLVNSIGAEIPASDYEIDYERGRIRAASQGSLGNDDHELTFNYYPIYKNPYIHESVWTNPNQLPYVPEHKDSDIFDGLSIQFNNDWFITAKEKETYWWTTEDGSTWSQNQADSTLHFIVSASDLDTNFDGKIDLKAIRVPNKYAVVFSDQSDFGQSYRSLNDHSAGTKTNFKVMNLTDNVNVPFYLWDYPLSHRGKINPFDYIYFYEKDSTGIDRYTWNITFALRQAQDPKTKLYFGTGDTLFIDFSKPFRNTDSFVFQGPAPEVDAPLVKNEMDDIRVVPNPYIVGHKFESPLPPGITSGRGTRKVEFQNLPSDSRVHIFTTRGQHLRTINHSGDMHTGTIKWDLKTKENLDIAFGVYYYIVESKTGGKKSGKLAVIK
jgi:hypothetical protein